MSDISPTRQVVAAEFIGTLLLVLIGTTAGIFTQGDIVAIALAFGLSLVVGIYAFGRISGAHFNPAVSVGAALGGRMPWGKVPIYVGAQVVGAVVGSFVLWVIVQSLPDGVFPDDQLGQNQFGNPGVAWWGALVVEIAITAILVGVILAVTDARNQHPGAAPLVIGLTLAAVHLATIPLTGTSANPARSIGPALFTGTESLKHLWLFIVAPLLGAALSGLAYPALFGHGTDPVPGSGLALGRPGGRRAATVPVAPDAFQQEWNQQEPIAESYGSWDGYGEEPIIQDGWQWDHQAQEWKALEDWPSPASGAVPTESATEPADPLGDPDMEQVVDPTGAAPRSETDAPVDEAEPTTERS